MNNFGKICLVALSFSLFSATMIISCAPKRKVIDAAKIATEKYKFVKNGETTKQEIINRLGGADNSYENGRIITYWWFERKRVYNLVLVFSEDDVVERHNIIRVR